MVLITVGTQKQDFSRIFKLVEESKLLKNEEIIAQSGYTKYESEKIKCIPFMSQEEFVKKIKEANFIICHGGVGTIFESLDEKKKVIAVPRLAKFGEHINDHQIEVCSALEKEHYIVYLKENETIDDKIKYLENNKLKEYKKNNNNKFLDILRKEI